MRNGERGKMERGNRLQSGSPLLPTDTVMSVFREREREESEEKGGGGEVEEGEMEGRGRGGWRELEEGKIGREVKERGDRVTSVGHTVCQQTLSCPCTGNRKSGKRGRWGKGERGRGGDGER